MLKILSVEDDYIASFMLNEQIERMGYFMVDTVETGEDAVELCQWMKPDLILMDITLNGDMDGIEASEKITEEAGSVPIIFITGITDPEIHKKARVLNPHGFFTKPVNVKALQQSIEEVFKKHR
ncbi:response regulator [Balneolales bacterium ANBcel1]|nr:response regulator [Balneolales bacterium ANBcel1]